MTWPLSILWSGITGSKYEPISQPTSDVKDVSASPTDLLQHFQSPGTTLPPSSRVGDPKLKQREAQPLSIWQLGKMGVFAAMKGKLRLES